VKSTALFFILISLSSTSAVAGINSFRIECDQFGSRIAFEYSPDKFKDTFLVGPAERRTKDLGAYDLINIEVKEEKHVGEYLEVHYDSNPQNHYGEDKSVMHQLRLYLKDKSFSVFSITLNKNRTRIISVLKNSTSSIIGPYSNCISIGI
jgi:hypothetical protein